MNEHGQKLARFFEEQPAVALAFSGGVDSSYLLYAARQRRMPRAALLRQDPLPAGV